MSKPSKHEISVPLRPKRQLWLPATQRGSTNSPSNTQSQPSDNEYNPSLLANPQRGQPTTTPPPTARPHATPCKCPPKANRGTKRERVASPSPSSEPTLRPWVPPPPAPAPTSERRQRGTAARYPPLQPEIRYCWNVDTQQRQAWLDLARPSDWRDRWLMLQPDTLALIDDLAALERRKEDAVDRILAYASAAAAAVVVPMDVAAGDGEEGKMKGKETEGRDKDESKARVLSTHDLQELLRRGQRCREANATCACQAENRAFLRWAIKLLEHSGRIPFGSVDVSPDDGTDVKQSS